MISLDPQIFIIRGGLDHFKYGDPYTFSVTAVKISEDTMEYRGLVGTVTMDDVREIRKAFLPFGITKAIWGRKK
jgi:hypothetical protein